MGIPARGLRRKSCYRKSVYSKVSVISKFCESYIVRNILSFLCCLHWSYGKMPRFLIKGGENVLGGYQKCRTKTFLVAGTQICCSWKRKGNVLLISLANARVEILSTSKISNFFTSSSQYFNFEIKLVATVFATSGFGLFWAVSTALVLSSVVQVYPKVGRHL